MPPGVVLIMLAGTVAAVAIIRTIASTILRFREQNLKESLPQSSVADERLARIEAAVEAIAIEVERISEGQRFTTKLLSDQSTPIQAFMSKPGKFDTPH